METLAFLHTAVAYEDPNPDRELRSFNSLNSNASSSILTGALSLGVLTAGLTYANTAQALMRYGNSGQGVAKLQQTLGITNDGIYGPKTEAAVIRFQQQRGLSVDGIAGSQTLSALGLPVDLNPSSETGTSRPVSTGAYVNAQVLNVRDYPNGPVLYTLNYGAQVALTGDRRAAGNFNWVQLSNGNWVAERYISYGSSMAPGTPTTPPATPVSSTSGSTRSISAGAYVNASMGLNVRDSPNGSIRYTLPYNSSIALSGDHRTAGNLNWVQLSDGNWVAERYISYR